jgi:hypothetical protein
MPSEHSCSIHISNSGYLPVIADIMAEMLWPETYFYCTHPLTSESSLQMPNIEFSLSAITLLTIVFFALMTGYAFRSRLTRKKQLKIRELKKEIMHNHAQILELQREHVALEMQMKNVTQVPVLQLQPAFRETTEEPHRLLDGWI